MGLWATWSCERWPCPWNGVWATWSSWVPANPNHSMSLWNVCASQAGLIAFSSGQFSFESHKKDTMTQESFSEAKANCFYRRTMDYHTRWITYTRSYQEFLRESNVFFWSAPTTKPKVSHLVFVCPLYQDCSFYHFQITYQSFLNKEPQSRPQALVLPNQHFDKVLRSLSVLFICPRLL